MHGGNGIRLGEHDGPAGEVGQALGSRLQVLDVGLYAFGFITSHNVQSQSDAI